MIATTKKLHFDIITLFPQIWQAIDHGITARCQQQAIFTKKTWQLRDYADKGDGRIDDKPYGGGPGMLMQ